MNSLWSLKTIALILKGSFLFEQLSVLLTSNCFHLGQCEIPYTLVHHFKLISKNCMFSSLFANVAAYFYAFKSLSDVRLLGCVIVLTALYWLIVYVHFPGG